LGLRGGGARTEVTVDLDASRDDLSGKPILSLFLCSSLFHLRPELTGPATPKPAGRRVKHLERGALRGFPNPPALWL
jgi:hypothetical protein